MSRPGVLPVRALNQYRSRDTLAYLGLRYYLQNSASRTDQWAREVATHLVASRTEPFYNKANHFKEILANGKVQHRPIFLPVPIEALAEAALIDACGSAGGKFTSSENVYSYRPCQGEDRQGVFENYMVGLKQRNAAITEACKRDPSAIVCFRDIKRFYPSVSIERGLRAWNQACEQSQLGTTYSELGASILEGYGHTTNGVLMTGPMFSHLVGNLVLGPLDRALSSSQCQYFRYVDDLAFVGTPTEVARALAVVSGELDAIGLELHSADSPKSLEIPAKDWLAGANHYSEDKGSTSWMTLVGDMRRLLLWHPSLADPLQQALSDEGFRLPVLDYRAAVAETPFLQRNLTMFRRAWYRAKVGGLSISTVVAQAKELRERLYAELSETVPSLLATSGFKATQILPRVRYLTGRLIYLAEPDQLSTIAEMTEKSPSLTFHSGVARAVGTREVGELIKLGGNAAQAAAQPLRTQNRKITLSRDVLNEGERDSLAVLSLNGLIVEGKSPSDSPLDDFARRGSSRELMQSRNLYIRELACLHGLSEEPRHETLMTTAFDPAEPITMDAIEQARGSLTSC